MGDSATGTLSVVLRTPAPPEGEPRGEPPIYLHSRKSAGIIAHFPLFFYRQKKITSADKLGIDFFSPVCYNSPNAGLVHR